MALYFCEQRTVRCSWNGQTWVLDSNCINYPHFTHNYHHRKRPHVIVSIVDLSQVQKLKLCHTCQLKHQQLGNSSCSLYLPASALEHLTITKPCIVISLLYLQHNSLYIISWACLYRFLLHLMELWHNMHSYIVWIIV